MHAINKDITTVSEGIIAHQTNCYGTMGAGVALAIREKYPKCFSPYVEWCRFNNPDDLLGTFQLVPTGPGGTNHLWVLNIFAQKGHNPADKPTNYFALGSALGQWKDSFQAHRLQAMGFATIYVPYLMGCGLGGGDWDTYASILEDFERASNWNIVVCRLPE